MKTLLLMRHAEALPPIPGGSDRERILTLWGRQQVIQQGEATQDLLVQVNAIFCSPAQRAVQTLEGLRPWLPSAEVFYEERLYQASAAEILHILQEKTPDTAQGILVIGHNPGIALFLEHVSKTQRAFPTAAIAHFRWEGLSWAELSLNELSLERLFLASC